MPTVLKFGLSNFRVPRISARALTANRNQPLARGLDESDIRALVLLSQAVSTAARRYVDPLIFAARRALSSMLFQSPASISLRGAIHEPPTQTTFGKER